MVFIIAATIVLPSTVAPAVPIVPEIIVLRVPFAIDRPNVLVIFAIIASSSGTSNAASENGIGLAPVAAAVAAATATIEFALSTFIFKSTH